MSTKSRQTCLRASGIKYDISFYVAIFDQKLSAAELQKPTHCYRITNYSIATNNKHRRHKSAAKNLRRRLKHLKLVYKHRLTAYRTT